MQNSKTKDGDRS